MLFHSPSSTRPCARRRGRGGVSAAFTDRLVPADRPRHPRPLPTASTAATLTSMQRRTRRRACRCGEPRDQPEPARTPGCRDRRRLRRRAGDIVRVFEQGGHVSLLLTPGLEAFAGNDRRRRLQRTGVRRSELIELQLIDIGLDRGRVDDVSKTVDDVLGRRLPRGEGRRRCETPLSAADDGRCMTIKAVVLDADGTSSTTSSRWHRPPKPLDLGDGENNDWN